MVQKADSQIAENQNKHMVGNAGKLEMDSVQIWSTIWFPERIRMSPGQGVLPKLYLSLVFCKTNVLKHIDFWQFPAVLEGLRSSRRLVGVDSTYPGTSPTSSCRVMAKKPPGGNVFRAW